MNVHLPPSGSQTVTYVKHYTDRLFSFRITRPKSLRFRSGEFVMIGLAGDEGRPLLRAYSIASPAWDDELEFYSIIVPGGPLTSRLKDVKPNDHVILRPKPVGTLVHDALRPGRRLFLVSTGTGIAPFASLLRDPETFEKFDTIVLTHTCRESAELQYGQELVAGLPQDPLVGEYAAQLRYVPTTTRQASAHMGRITDWILQKKLIAHLGMDELNAQTDRFMICGSVGLNNDMRQILDAMGFQEGSNAQPGDYTVEKAFVS